MLPHKNGEGQLFGIFPASAKLPRSRALQYFPFGSQASAFCAAPYPLEISLRTDVLKAFDQDFFQLPQLDRFEQIVHHTAEHGAAHVFIIAVQPLRTTS